MGFHLETELEIFGRSGSVRARASGTQMLFAVLTTFHWCKIIGAHQLAPFRNLGACSERDVGNTLILVSFCANKQAKCLRLEACLCL